MAENNPANTSFGGQSILSRVTSFRHSHRVTLLIQLLDESEQLSLQFKGSELGQAVLDAVCEQLDVVERDYFGLRYLDSNKFRYWLDLDKPLNRQFKGDCVTLSLRFRFYPKDPFYLREEVTRYQLFVQLRRDLLHGRLFCSQTDAVQLAALIVQAHLGDYDPTEHGPGYVSEYKLLLKQTEKLEDQIAEAHRGLIGLTPADAENRFFEIACRVPTYGFDPYVVKNPKQDCDFTIGATCNGILVFNKNRLLQNIPWNDISKLDYTGKELRLYPTSEHVQNQQIFTLHNDKHVLDVTTSTIASNGETSGFNTSLNTSSKSNKSASGSKKFMFKFVCPTSLYAKHLWRHLLSQQVFFTEEKAKLVKPKFSRPRIPLLSRGSTFRCPLKRVQHEIEKEPAVLRDHPPLDFPRYSLPKQIARSEYTVSSRTATLKSTKSILPAGDTSSNSNTLEPHHRAEPEFLYHVSFAETDMNGLPTPRMASTPVKECGDGGEAFGTLAASTSTSTTANVSSQAPVEVLDSTAENSRVSTTSVKMTSDEDLTKTSAGNSKPPSPTIVRKVVQTDDTCFYSSEIPSGSNGGLTNGRVNGGHAYDPDKPAVVLRSKAKKSTLAPPPRASMARGVLRSLLSCLLFLLAIFTFVVVVFEANNGRGAKWIRDLPHFETVRQVAYDPAKDVVEQMLHRISHRFHQ